MTSPFINKSLLYLILIKDGCVKDHFEVGKEEAHLMLL